MHNVVVRNISILVTEPLLRELFECCGTIKQLVLENPNTEHARCVIGFSEECEASAAVVLSGTPLGDKTLAVHHERDAPFAFVPDSGAAALPKDPNLADSEERANRTIYCGNLEMSATEEHVKAIFAKCGPIEIVRFASATNPAVVAGANFAFIEFCTKEGQMNALKMNRTIISGKELKISQSKNAILKSPPDLVLPSKSQAEMEAIMEKVRKAQGRIAEKVEEEESRKRSRSRSRGRRRRSSRSRSRGRRRRSRSRGRRRRSRTPPPPPKKRSTTPPHVAKKKKLKNEHADEYFDGYTWKKIADLPPDMQTVLPAAIAPVGRLRR